MKTNEVSLPLVLLCCPLPLLFTAQPVDAQENGEGKCYRHFSDVMFAIDSSYSLRSEQFQQQLNLLKNLVDRYSIGRRYTRVGVVSFSSKVRLHIKLDQFDSKSQLKAAIGNIVHYDEVGTYTHEAIRYVRSQAFQPENGGRPWVTKKLILITDGYSDKPNLTLAEASAAKREGLEIFGVGVDGVMDDPKFELPKVVSEPKDKHLFLMKNYRSVNTLNKMLSDATCERQAEQECKNITSADVIFVLDSSNSIWSVHFEKMVDFVRNVTSMFDIGSDAVRVGLMIYSERVYEYILLDDRQTKRRLKKILDMVEPRRGYETNTHLAIQRARIRMLSKARRNAPRIIVLLTDGASSDAKKTEKEARLAHREGIHIFAIGIGKRYDEIELKSIASDPDEKYLLHANNYESLSSIKDLLVMKSCDVVTDTAQKDSSIAKCSTRPNDVVFVYDAEWLSPQKNNFIVTTITDVIESEILNTRELRFGVIRNAFHGGQPRDIKLTNKWKQPDFKTKLDANSKRSLIYKLLKKARIRYFNDLSNASRKRTVVLFLDSEMKDWSPTRRQALWLEISKVHIIVVGLGKHFNKLQALNLTGFKNLITVTLDHGEERSLYVVKEIIDRLCSDEVM